MIGLQSTTAMRLGIVMRADPERPEEAGGVLNPAVARGPDATLHLFPRLVDAKGSSRIGHARVRFDEAGTPVGVERLGIALEPQEPYELRPQSGDGGCEDPRITYVEPLRCYIMAYCAFGPEGARVALARSDDLESWERLGLVDFEPRQDPVYRVDFDNYYNKDGVLFPDSVVAPDGQQALTLLHRPTYDRASKPASVEDPRPAIWISYCPLSEVLRDPRALRQMRQHQVLIEPEFAWEAQYIGGGTPPIRTVEGWLLLYHGVRHQELPPGDGRKPLRYSAGALLLDADDPRIVRYRSPQPVLQPDAPAEQEGSVAGAVFPTGLDDRGEGRIDIYYGMADARIGVARLELPTLLLT